MAKDGFNFSSFCGDEHAECLYPYKTSSAIVANTWKPVDFIWKCAPQVGVLGILLKWPANTVRELCYSSW